MDKIWAAVKDLLASKKFLAALLSVAVYLLGKAGLNLTVEQLLPVLGPLWGYIFGQSLADFGKSSAQVQLQAVSTAAEAMKEKPADPLP